MSVDTIHMTVDEERHRQSTMFMFQEVFWAHFMSSALGLQPVVYSIAASSIDQKHSFSRGQFSHPVVMQKYVSCGATWWIRWCLLGRMILFSCNQTTQRGKPKYVCDHLWIWNVNNCCYFISATTPSLSNFLWL